MSKQYKVRKNQTVRYENPTGVVKYLRLAQITSQSAITLHDFKGKAAISAVPKTYTDNKKPRRAWVNA